jgi:methyl-accepting chemotaxis protein
MQNARLFRAIDAAIDAHAEWKRRLHRAIETGNAQITSATAACDDKCDLGKWLYSAEVEAAFQEDVLYRRVVESHAMFHRTAGSVLSYVERGNRSAALFIMDGEYGFESEELIKALTKWKASVAVEPAARAAHG